MGFWKVLVLATLSLVLDCFFFAMRTSGPQVGYIYEDAFRELYAEKSVEAEPDPAEAAPDGAQSCIRAGCRISTVLP